MTVEEKKKAVEEFLDIQGDNQVEEVSDEEKPTTPAPFAGRYKSDTGLFSGGFEGEVDIPEAPVEEPTLPATAPPLPAPTPPPIPPPEPPYDVGELLSIMIQNQGTFIEGQNKIIKGQDKVIENQEVERREYNRSHILVDDSPVYDWAEAIGVEPGYQVTFTLTIPEGSVFFFEYFNITYNADTIYNISIDSVGSPTLPTLTDVLQDFGDHNIMFRPPKLCYQDVVITALNNGAIAQTYSVFVRGWFRQSVKIDKEYIGSR